jgi:IPT/TIG domain
VPNSAVMGEAPLLLRRSRARRVGVGVVATLVAALAFVAGTSAASAEDRWTAVRNASAYGPAHGYRVGVAVYDTKTDNLYANGAADGTFASESVVKAMIATRLLLQGRMHGSTATRAYKMITQSDDAIASSFYGSVGGDGLINYIKSHYHVPTLGSPPHRAGWWGNTHITASGLVRWYAKVKKDPKVGPWLLNAMHHATKYGSDGTYQFFGLPSATTGAAVKQGWGDDYDDWGKSADFNTTGFVNGDRFAVAILARGPVKTYGSAIGSMLTHTARLLLPNGSFPLDTPRLMHMTHRSGPVAGGQLITITGSDFTSVSAVTFGGVKGTALKVVSSRQLQITSPPHRAGRAPVLIVTDHGTSRPELGAYTYIGLPTVTSMTPTTGPVAGGQKVTIHGTNFVHVSWVSFGATTKGTSVHVSSSTALTVIAPPGAAGAVPVRIRTWYGTSPPRLADHFTYIPPPAITGLAPPSGPSAGGTTVTLSGTGMSSITAVRFGATPASGLTHPSATTLSVVAPPHAAGAVDVQVSGAYGSSAIGPADRYTYTP